MFFRFRKTMNSLCIVVLVLTFWGRLLGNSMYVYAQGFVPGTYVGSAEGFHGDVKVEVTLTEDRIVSIDVSEDETAGVGDKAIEQLVASVIESQSLNHDVVSGATYSSEGFLAALALALDASGADLEALKTKEVDASLDEAITSQTTDVVVVGGGGAGLAAAVSAHQNGANVILVEKMPRLGGNTIISGAAYNAADSERQVALVMTENEVNTVEEILAEVQKMN